MTNLKKNKARTKIKILGDLLASKITKARKPILANLLITNRCNLKCFYCYVDVFNRKMQDLSTEEIIRIIDILHANGTKIIVLLGGEPLLRKDIDAIIEHINSKGIICELITNGFGVDKWIKSLRLLDSVCVSLDGNEYPNDLNRGSGAFRVATEAIRLLKENRVNTRIKAVITKNNIDALAFLAKFVKDNSILMTCSAAVVYEQREYNQNLKWMGNDDVRELLIKLKEHKRKGIPIGYSYKALDYCINWPSEYNHVVKNLKQEANFKFIKCLRKDFSLYMDADGTIYPCANLWGKGGGNILKEDFKAAWDKFNEYDCYCCGNNPDVDISLILNLELAGMVITLRNF